MKGKEAELQTVCFCRVSARLDNSNFDNGAEHATKTPFIIPPLFDPT